MSHPVATLLLLPLFLQQAPLFKTEATFVKVPVTVFDPHGRILPDLRREDFVLLDEGEPRPIENFLLDRSPIHVVLLLDVSGSLRQELEEIREAAWHFVQAFGREDRIAILSFSDKVEVLQNWTNDRKALRKAIKQIERGYRTALYDAIQAATTQTLAGVSGKKVIILLTDGLDNESEFGFDEVTELLIESNVSLYIVSRTRLVRPEVEKSERVDFLNRVMKNVLKDDQDFVDIYFREKETAMTHLSESSGGRVFFPEKLEDLTDSYIRLARELKSQYVLTFRPAIPSGKQFRNIQVICTEPVGQIYYRKKYWMGSD